MLFDIERFIVLDVIEGLVERQNQDNDLRCQFEESEAKAASLEIKVAQYSRILSLAMNALIAQGSLDTGATL